MINHIFQYQLACESFYLKGTALWSDQYIGALYKTHLLPFKIGSCQPLVSNKYKKTRKRINIFVPSVWPEVTGLGRMTRSKPEKIPPTLCLSRLDLNLPIIYPEFT